MYYRLVRLMTLWPGLIREYSELHRGNLGIDSYELYVKVQRILEELKTVNRERGHRERAAPDDNSTVSYYQQPDLCNI